MDTTDKLGNFKTVDVGGNVRKVQVPSFTAMYTWYAGVNLNWINQNVMPIVDC
jgi:hypothetical protein